MIRGTYYSLIQLIDSLYTGKYVSPNKKFYTYIYIGYIYKYISRYDIYNKFSSL
jgi:hypothetical protein